MLQETGRLSIDHPIVLRLKRHSRALLTGPSGSGKTTLARAAAASLAAHNLPCYCLGADPGLPGFGPPGALCLGKWQQDEHGAGDWQLKKVAALATLDASRFRLPLVEALRHLCASLAETPLIVDAPGVVRGIGGAELLPALVSSGRIDTLVKLAPSDAPDALSQEYRALGVEQLTLTPDPQAQHPGKQLRTQRRTQAWDAYLASATEQSIGLSRLAVIGTPPPRRATDAWRGRQLGLLDAQGNTLALGEIIELRGDRLHFLAPTLEQPPHTLVIRDAQRRRNGQLGTARPYRAPEAAPAVEPAIALPPLDAQNGPRPTLRLNDGMVTLMNGVFGDPLLHLRMRHQKRSLLFDLGDPGRLTSRLAHQVSDVFISHAHIDHIGGFLWLLRSRIGDFPACRFYGPPGLAEHLAGLVRGILWDRVADRAPRFEIQELHGDTLKHYLLTAGQALTALPACPVQAGILLEEQELRVRATTLDHGTPVLAFAFEPQAQIKVRKERLEAHGLTPGPWLGELKHCVRTGNSDARMTLPNGESAPVATLSRALLFTEPGKRLVYATDLGDTQDNRKRLITLARDAHVLFCEAPFREDEADQARRTGHLTARACGEIATAANVGQLVPFHFSRRHANDAETLYAEIRPYFPRLAEAPGNKQG
ncbi:MBL fold metallo-hydrolase [Vreelandella rituensis]|uniref:MBL fold metallo-hydrolase n=1 Tax=Vreelandella rituensis TaxID=2282306 RepID=A0A368U395_9GAMM|nr:MBL fold metallo-hydrolase [Halomonas rituensis]RCV91484.1 MBL fold metallo-hydrolase [Halomonas rituensis]